jgi:hypothetical protein
LILLPKASPTLAISGSNNMRSFPELLKRTTIDVCSKRLDSTEIIEAIAKNTSDLPQCLKINPNL